MRSNRFTSRISLQIPQLTEITIIFIVLLLLYPWFRAFPWGFLEDDSYFYSQIAYNWALKGFPTFDGIHTTSGFHLLNGAILAFISKLLMFLTHQKGIHLFAHIYVWSVLVWALAKLISPQARGRWLPVVLALTGGALMESAVLALLIVRIIAFENRDHFATDRARLLCLFLIPLTRIDASIVGICLLFSGNHLMRQRWVAAASLLLGIGTHFALMQILFGEWFSTSSILKASDSKSILQNLAFNFMNHSWGYFFRCLVLVVIIACGTLVTYRLRKSRPMHFLAWTGVSFFSVIHLVSNVMRAWYFVPSYLVCVFLFNSETKKKIKTQLVVEKSCLILISIFALSFLSLKTYRMINSKSAREASWDFVSRLKEIVPPRAAIYQIDGSGYIGFHSERNIVNGDGLVNSYEYIRRRLKGQLQNYLDEEGICYFILNQPESDDAPLLINLSGLQMPRANTRELLRSSAYGQYPYSSYRLFVRTDGVCAKNL